VDIIRFLRSSSGCISSISGARGDGRRFFKSGSGRDDVDTEHH